MKITYRSSLLSLLLFQDPSGQSFDEECRESTKEWFTRMLQPRSTNELVFLFGGWSGKEPSNMIQVLNPITYQWTITPLKLPEMRIYYAAAEVEGIIYIIGGFDNTSRGLNSTWAFEPLSGTWTPKQPMFDARCYASSVVHEGKIVVMGGYDDSQAYSFIDIADHNPGRRFKSVEMWVHDSNNHLGSCLRKIFEVWILSFWRSRFWIFTKF